MLVQCVKLTVYSDVDSVCFCHPLLNPGDKVVDLAVELSVLVLLLHKQAQLTLHWEQPTGVTGGDGVHVHLWRTTPFVKHMRWGERGKHMKIHKAKSKERNASQMSIRLTIREHYAVQSGASVPGDCSAWGSRLWPHRPQSVGEERRQSQRRTHSEKETVIS